MKLLFTLVALAAPAAGFVLQSPIAPATALYSSYVGSLGDGVSTARSVGQPQAPPMQGGSNMARGNISDKARTILDSDSLIKVQGNSLKTWSFQTPAIERVQILMKTEGRPLNANVELWQGPDNTPQKMNVYIEDGNVRPFSAIVETPGGQNAVAIRNTATMEYPLEAAIEAEVEDPNGNGSAGLSDVVLSLAESAMPRIIQGGAVFTKPFPPAVQSVQILLKTDGRPLNARVELIQGPNNNKQVIEVYTEDGMERPFFIVLESPGSGNVVRIVNTATMEYPITARVEPYIIDDSIPEGMGSSFFIVD